jgi:ACS family hexuronate transporter-like MFS transporter
MTLVSLISYIDRNTLALLAPTILASLALTNEQYGWAVSGFSWAYMLGNLAWGRWIDRFGLRIAMTAAVAMWTIASASHALVIGFLTLFLARTALGFGEGATFPGGLRTVVQTLPATMRARGVAVAFSGGSLGAVITPIVMTPVFKAFGWQGAFWFTGAIGLAWLAMWSVLSRREDIRRIPETPQEEPRAGWRDRRFWAFVLIYAFGAAPLGFTLYFASPYLRTLGKSQIEIGNLLWIPPLGWELGYFVWGWLIDKTAHKHGHQKLFAALTILSIPLAFAPYVKDITALMALLFFAMFIASGFIVGGVSFGTTAFGVRDSAYLAGISSGAWSALVAIVTPMTGRLFDHQLYAEAFLLAALLPAAGLLAHRACYSK